MKATFEFSLPEDQADFRLHVKASEAYGVLHDIHEYCFNIVDEQEPSTETRGILEKILAAIRESGVLES